MAEFARFRCATRVARRAGCPRDPVNWKKLPDDRVTLTSGRGREGSRSFHFEQVERLDLAREALEGEVAHGLGVDQLLDGRQHALGDEHLPGPRLAAQAARQIGDAADRAVVQPPLEADRADRREALGDARRRRRARSRACASRPRARRRGPAWPAPSGPRAPPDSGTGTGSLKKTIMPSPAKRSSVPSWARTSVPISRWYSRRTPMTSSGSAVSAKAVKPRRSRKTTVTSRRWRPERIFRTARHDQLRQLGREEALEPREALELADLLRHALLERPVQLGELGRLGLHGVVELLDAEERPDPREKLGLIHRLREEVVRAGLEPLDPLLRRGPARSPSPPAGCRSRDRPGSAAHLVAAHLRASPRRGGPGPAAPPRSARAPRRPEAAVTTA